MSTPRRGHGRRGGHEEEHEEHENHERWLVSYADMMTLLMVLFIVMFAISSINQGKFDQLKQGLHTGFGSPQTIMAGGSSLLESGGAVAPDPPQVDGLTQGGAGGTDVNSWKAANPQQLAKLVNATQQAQVRQEVENLKRAEAALKAALARAGVPRGATFRFDERGLVVTVATDKVLFDSASADLRAQGRRHPRRAGADAGEAPEPDQRRRPHELAADRDRPVPVELGAVDRPGHGRPALPRRGRGTSRRAGSPRPASRTPGPLLPASDPRALVVNRRVEVVVLAAVDDSAGRAVAQLGNAADSQGASDG